MTRYLDRLTYQQLRVSAQACGGIGAYLTHDYGVPCCVLGHAVSIGGRAVNAIRVAGLSPQVSDAAVTRVNRRAWWRLGFLTPARRVPFDLWCKALNLEPRA